MNHKTWDVYHAIANTNRRSLLELYREARGMVEISLQAEPAPGHEAQPAGPLSRRLEFALRAAFDLRIPVRIVPPGSLPRFEMKAKRWVKIAR